MILTEERSRGQRLELLDLLYERSERIGCLRAAIEDGTYQPDPSQIARAIMARGF